MGSGRPVPHGNPLKMKNARYFSCIWLEMGGHRGTPVAADLSLRGLGLAAKLRLRAAWLRLVMRWMMTDDGYTEGRTLPSLRGRLAFGRGEVDCGWLLLLAQFLHTARERDYSGRGLLPGH